MRFRPAEGTHFAAMNDESGVVLDLQSRSYLQLNASGALLWKSVENGATHSELTRVLVHRYGLDPERAGQDALSWIDDMLRRGVLVRER